MKDEDKKLKAEYHRKPNANIFRLMIDTELYNLRVIHNEFGEVRA